MQIEVHCSVTDLKVVFYVFQGKCPGKWHTYKGACYQLQYNKAGWKEARKNCLHKGADLVTIRCKEESEELRRYIEKSGQAHTFFWIGTFIPIMNQYNISVSVLVFLLLWFLSIYLLEFFDAIFIKQILMLYILLYMAVSMKFYGVGEGIKWLT